MVDTRNQGSGTEVEEEGVLAASHLVEVAGDSLVMEGLEGDGGGCGGGDGGGC